MKKLWILLVCSGSLIAMQPQEIQYTRTATDALAQLLNRDGFSEMKPVQIQNVLNEIRNLVVAGADPNVRPPQMYTPLIFAIHYYNPELIKLLLNKGASLNFASFARINPLDFALRERNMNAAGLLLDSIDINKAAFANNETWLTDAIRRREDLIPLLLQRGADFKTKRRLRVGPPALPQITEVEVDPLGLAILLNKTKAAKALIEAGANVNQVYSNNRTPLMWAIARDNREVVQSLIENGAWKSLNVRNSQGKTAGDIAHEKGLNEIAKLLKGPKIL